MQAGLYVSAWCLPEHWAPSAPQGVLACSYSQMRSMSWMPSLSQHYIELLSYWIFLSGTSFQTGICQRLIPCSLKSTERLAGTGPDPSTAALALNFHGPNCILTFILPRVVFYKHLSLRAGSKSFIYLHSPRSFSFSFWNIYWYTISHKILKIPDLFWEQCQRLLVLLVWEKGHPVECIWERKFKTWKPWMFYYVLNRNK